MAQRIKDEEIKLKISVDASSGTKELDELRKSSKLNTMTIADLNTTAKKLRLSLAGVNPNTKEFKEYNKALRSVNTRLKELRSGSAKTSGMFSKLGKAAMGVVAMFQIASKAIRTIANAVSAVVSKIADFEQANANLATILGKGINEIGMLTDAAQTLGRTTEYTASQVTLLQTELAKLGFNEGQILAMEKPVLQFATAVGADLPEAASFAGAALRIFNLKASDAEDTLASFAIATNKSALSFSYLQEAMSTVGPVAQTFGFGVKDTTALLGILANSGFDASSAATATRNILLNLADANGKLAQALGVPFQIKLMGIPMQIIKRYEPYRISNHLFNIGSHDTINKRIKEVAKLCGIEKRTSFHLSCHTFAVLALNYGMPIESVSKILGHTNITTTQIYAKVTNTKLEHDISMFESSVYERFAI